METIELAAIAVAAYAQEQYREARRHGDICGCRSCKAARDSWTDWITYQDDAVEEYEPDYVGIVTENSNIKGGTYD